MTDRYTEGWCAALEQVTAEMRRMQARHDTATARTALLEAENIELRADLAEARHLLDATHQAIRTGARAPCDM